MVDVFKMMKLKPLEIGILVLVVLVAYIISLYMLGEDKFVEQPKVFIPEGASDDFVIEQAYQHADETVCEHIDEGESKDECLERVEDKKFLDEGVEKAKKEFSGVSAEDQILLGKALVGKDSSLCEQIIDEATKQKCFDLLV